PSASKPPLVDKAKPSDTQKSSTQSRKGSWTPGIVVTGLGAAGVGFGAVTGAMALSAGSDVKASCQDGLCPPSQQTRGEHVKSLATMSTAGLVAGGVVMATGVVLLIVRPFGRSAPSARVSAAPGSILISGSF